MSNLFSIDLYFLCYKQNCITFWLIDSFIIHEIWKNSSNFCSFFIAGLKYPNNIDAWDNFVLLVLCLLWEIDPLGNNYKVFTVFTLAQYAENK